MSKIFKIRVPEEVIMYKDMTYSHPGAGKLYQECLQLGEDLVKGVDIFVILPSTRQLGGSYVYDIELMDTDGEEVNSFAIESSNIPQPPPKRFLKEGSSGGF